MAFLFIQNYLFQPEGKTSMKLSDPIEESDDSEKEKAKKKKKKKAKTSKDESDEEPEPEPAKEPTPEPEKQEEEVVIHLHIASTLLIPFLYLILQYFCKNINYMKNVLKTKSL